MSNRKALAAAVGAVLAGGGLARGALVGQWIGDNYTSGATTWADSSGAGSTGEPVIAEGGKENLRRQFRIGVGQGGAGQELGAGPQGDEGDAAVLEEHPT